MSKFALKAPPPPFERTDRVWFRRGLGFTVKARIDEPGSARVIVKRHGGDRETVLARADLRRLMALDRFREWPADEAWLRAREAEDLVYWSRFAADRATTGAPLLSGRDARVALRDGVGVTLAIADDEEILPWVFMPRLDALTGKHLRGVRFSSLEQGTEVYAVDLYGTDREADILRDVLPLLDGARTWTEIEAAFSGRDRAAARAVLEWLDDCALLTAAPPPQLALDRDGVVWLGHAAVLVRAGDRTLLVDPLFMRRSDPPRPFVEAPFDWRTLPKIDAVLITHADNDHLNPPTLARLDRSLPVIVPAAPAAKPYQVDLSGVLRFLGFTDVRAISPWQRLPIGNSDVIGVPFMGEDWGLELPKTTFLISGPRSRVYLSADSANDDAIFTRVRADYGAVDFAFLGISGCEEPLVAPPGFGYGEFYAVWLPRARRNQWLLHTQGPAGAAHAVRLLEAKRAFGYAAGGGSFMEMSHSDQGTHADLARELGLLGLSERAIALSLGVPFNL